MVCVVCARVLGVVLVWCVCDVWYVYVCARVWGVVLTWCMCDVWYVYV